MIESELFSYLTAQTTVTDYVANRIYPDTAPENVTSPFIVFGKTDTNREYTLTSANAICTARFQMDVLANTRLTCELIVEAIRLSTDGFQGNWGTTFVHLSKCDSESVGFDLLDGKDTGIHRASFDLIVMFSESTTDFFGG